MPPGTIDVVDVPEMTLGVPPTGVQENMIPDSWSKITRLGAYMKMSYNVSSKGWIYNDEQKK